MLKNLLFMNPICLYSWIISSIAWPKNGFDFNFTNISTVVRTKDPYIFNVPIVLRSKLKLEKQTKGLFYLNNPWIQTLIAIIHILIFVVVLFLFY